MNAHTKQFGLRSFALILVIAALLFGGASITGVAAQSAIPGDALYPVKTTIEQTRFSLAQDAGDRAQMKMAFAQQRLDEIAALIQEGRYHEIREAVLAFEAAIHSAILELETISQIDPTRGTQIALEITSALTRYAQTLSEMAANAPESVRLEVTRALDTTQIAGSLELSPADMGIDDNSNGDDDNVNMNGNDNLNSNGDDDNANTNVNANDNGDDANANANDNGDDANANDNGDDDIANANTNANDNGDDNSNDNGADDNTNGNGAGDNSNSSNGNGDDDQNGNSNDNSNDDSGNDNGGSGGGGQDDNSNGSGGGHGGNDNGGGGGGGDDDGNGSGGGGHGGNDND